MKNKHLLLAFLGCAILFLLPSCVDSGYYGYSGTYSNGAYASNSLSTLPYGYTRVVISGNPYWYRGDRWYRYKSGRYLACSKPRGYHRYIKPHPSYYKPSHSPYRYSSNYRYSTPYNYRYNRPYSSNYYNNQSRRPCPSSNYRNRYDRSRSSAHSRRGNTTRNSTTRTNRSQGAVTRPSSSPTITPQAPPSSPPHEARTITPSAANKRFIPRSRPLR